MELTVLLWVLIAWIIVKRIVECVKEVIEINQYEGCSIGNIISLREDVRREHLRKVCVYYPTYQYLAEGMVYESESSWAYRQGGGQKVGDKVILYYDKNMPERYVTYDEEKYWRETAAKWVVLLEAFFLLTIYCWGKPILSQ